MSESDKEYYYSLPEVMTLFGKSKSTIIRETNSGKIPSEGDKHNRKYPKKAIDALLAFENKKGKNKQIPDLVFSPSTNNDSWHESQRERALYGEENIVPYQRVIEWKHINAEMFMSLKVKGKVVGYASFIPLEEQVILDLIHDKIREQDIPDEAIKQWSDQQLSVYVTRLAINPSGNKTRDAQRAAIVIKNMVRWGLALDQQYNIKNWYSVAATKQGQHLLEELGFTEMTSLHNGQRKGYYLDSIKTTGGLINKIEQGDIRYIP
jgi:hypothetical protein